METTRATILLTVHTDLFPLTCFSINDKVVIIKIFAVKKDSFGMLFSHQVNK